MREAIAHRLEKILSGYYALTRKPFRGGYALSVTVTANLPNSIQRALALTNEYLVEGSCGNGRWTFWPWVAIFNRQVTDSAQHGFYVVFLFRSDLAGVYLSLNQGVTDIKRRYPKPAAVLSELAADYRARIPDCVKQFPLINIDLVAKRVGDNGSLYERGNICAKYYKAGSLPSDKELLADLRNIIELYDKLRIKDALPVRETDQEEDEPEDEKTRVQLRLHKRYERNRSLTVKAKRIHGYTCGVCKFNFEKGYGELGRGYIEAHHKTPFHLLPMKVRLDPREDFVTVCANCHRMLHRKKTGLPVDELRKAVIQQSG